MSREWKLSKMGKALALDYRSKNSNERDTWIQEARRDSLEVTEDQGTHL